MRTSDKGLLMLMRNEAVVLSAYKDSVGVWTLGVGHTASAGLPKPVAGMTVTLASALALLREDIEAYEKGVNRAVKVPLAQHEYDALVQFHYNTGAIAKASLVNKLNKGDRLGAADGLRAWNKAGGKVSKGLVRRREEERKLFLTGDYGDISKVPVYDKYPGKVRAMPAGSLLSASAKEAAAPEPAAVVVAPAPAPEIPKAVEAKLAPAPSDPKSSRGRLTKLSLVMILVVVGVIAAVMFL